MLFFQSEFLLKSRRRGFHLITDDILYNLPEIRKVNVGTLNLFIKHTSASLSLNENADPSVRVDMESAFNVIAPEDQLFYTHTYEGSDDMPAHIKSSIIGASLTIPITNGKLNLGVWQGIYLCEHRDRASSRSIVATIIGE